MTRRLVTPLDVSRMQALADRGLTQPQIAERTGWSLTTVERNVRTVRGRLIGSFREVSSAEADEMRRLAKQGLSRTQIAVKVGRSWQAVSRQVGDVVPARAGRAPDVARYRRMLKAVAAAEYGSRDEIARRFGLKDRFSLKTTLVAARRAVAATSALEEAVRREAAARGEIAA